MTPDKELELFEMLGRMDQRGKSMEKDIKALRSKSESEDKELGQRVGTLEGDVKSVKRAGMMAAAAMSPAMVKLKAFWAQIIG